MDNEKQTISTMIGKALKLGWSVIASVRGVSFSQDRDVQYYIDVTATSPDLSDELDIGFWPGMNKDYAITEQDLADIKDLHPSVKIERAANLSSGDEGCAVLTDSVNG